MVREVSSLLRRLGSPRARRWVALGGLLVVTLSALSALARPGGGHSYSGGGSSHVGSGGGGGGGGGGGLLLELLIWLLIRNPAIGIPVLIVVIVLWGIQKAISGRAQDWSTGQPTGSVADTGRAPQSTRAVPRAALDRLRASDPDFSVVLFEDFLFLLYAEVQRARALGPDKLAVWLAPGLLEAFPRDAELQEVRGIVIGALRVVSFSGMTPQGVTLELEVEANYSEVSRDGRERRYYVFDRLTVGRGPAGRSRPFARASILDCPNCGAPTEGLRGTQCTYCRQEVGGGRLDWLVVGMQNLSKETRGPLLTSDVAEQGTALPTVADPGGQSRWLALQSRDPSVTWEGLMARVQLIFTELQAGWSNRDAARIRPWVSDNLMQSMSYWLELYQQRHCRNVTEKTQILDIVPANVLSDAHFDAVTVRLTASGLDYTLGDDGKLLSGSKSRPRTYSEYWTLIRGSQHQGPARTELVCPGCGAPLRIGMAGHCEYCRAKVTSGQFDWVLSRIEQDEAYTG